MNIEKDERLSHIKMCRIPRNKTSIQLTFSRSKVPSQTMLTEETPGSCVWSWAWLSWCSATAFKKLVRQKNYVNVLSSYKFCQFYQDKEASWWAAILSQDRRRSKGPILWQAALIVLQLFRLTVGRDHTHLQESAI